jgi:nucleotide-binding universal stress UspA family protein
MLERILVPLDPSDTSQSILASVAFLAKRLHQPVHLVSVIPDSAELHAIGPRHAASMGALGERLRSAAQERLDSVQAHLAQQGIATTVEVSGGPVAECILVAADAFGAGLIAMATHGRVGPERWFLGSIADRVLRGSSTPVLLVRPRPDGQAAAPSIDHVILPLDGSSLSEAALPYATFLAQGLQAPMTLVRTVDVTALSAGDYAMAEVAPELLDLLESDVKEYLAEMAVRVGNTGINVRQACSIRSPAGEIIDRVHTTRHALVVMSTHGRSGLGRTLLGSVTDRVIRSSDAPVLVIRPTEASISDAHAR